ncbi:endonuclease [Qingshengfaniella alkalisoli]|uniref:Endonuclease n=1 Tax=Qingshengfaniella alkalisoli TaxID=2599296 RepID=A0A5B8IX28_9RHOB|nr:endonuclease [Qingshengfaniella alkalisoli]QDY69118.1 endonuclease [Qingshengfaniella alkalisoli]
MPTHCVAFWNLENLFGPENHPPRIDWIRTVVASDLRGWTENLYRTKLGQLAHIISKMNNGAGPDILGVCEAEDRFVLTDLAARASELTGRQYGLVHADNSHDQRGIDTAFLYDIAAYSVDPDLIFNHFVVRRTGTRDVLQATFRSLLGNDLVIMCNHWPSRSGGTMESAGFRATAGETVGYWHERIREIVGADASILAIGDFNDDPWNDSLMINANAERERGDVVRARSAKFYNFAWEYLSFEAIDHRGDPRRLHGTLYYGADGNVFDQILASGPLLDNGNTAFKAVNGSARVEALPEMVDHRAGNGPRRFGLPRGNAASNVDPTGFSDHFPVSILVTETGGTEV